MHNQNKSSNSHFEKISLWLIVQHVENICKGSCRLFLLRCNQYSFHRSLNAPTPVVCPPASPERLAQWRTSLLGTFVEDGGHFKRDPSVLCPGKSHNENC